MFSSARTPLILKRVLGLYIMIAGMSLYFLHQRKGSSRGRRVTVAFTWFMLVITIAWFYCETRFAEAELVESPVTTAAWTNYCSPTNVVGNVLSALQFFGSDALLVRTQTQAAFLLKLRVETGLQGRQDI
jgi:uncharacterized membrane protein